MASGRATHVSGLGKVLDAMNAELTDEEKIEIQEIFSVEIVPKLKKLSARLGTISCEFAGPQYTNWMIQFRSRGEDFEIVDFEYDEEGAGIDLDV
jgi:hypothetical protein